MVLINGSDETVHHEPLPIIRGRPIAIKRVRGGHVLMRYKRVKRRLSDLHRAVDMCFDDAMSPPIAINLDRYSSIDEWSRLILQASKSGL